MHLDMTSPTYDHTHKKISWAKNQPSTRQDKSTHNLDNDWKMYLNNIDWAFGEFLNCI